MKIKPKTKLTLLLAAAGGLALSTQAQDTVVNIQASGIYEGGNTVISGIPFTDGASFSQTYTLDFDSSGVFQLNSSLNSATETITINSTDYSYSFSSIHLIYGHNDSIPVTQFDLLAGGSNPLSFGFYIRENANPQGGVGGNTLYLTDLAPILNTFQAAIDNGNTSGVLDMNNTYIYANGQDYASTVGTGSIQPTPEPSTLALAGLGGLSALFLRRRK